MGRAEEQLCRTQPWRKEGRKKEKKQTKDL